MPPLQQQVSATSGAPVDGTPPPAADRAVRRTRTAATVASAALVLALVLAGCGGGSSSPSAGPTSPSATFGGHPPMATVVTVDKVAGNARASYHRAFHARAGHLARQVGRAVDSWFDGGFVAVDYPTTTYPDAFKAFTAQAKVDARRQRGLMTGGPLGGHIDGVTTLQRKVSLDVLAPKGKPAGVTARVVLRFKTAGQPKEKKVTVTGRLFLTRGGGGAWRIFGFDVAKGVRG